MVDRYYASVFGGQICRDCGAVVMGIKEHDDFHEEQRRTRCDCRTVFG